MAIECKPESPVEGRQLYASSLAALAAKGDDWTTEGAGQALGLRGHDAVAIKMGACPRAQHDIGMKLVTNFRSP